MFSIEKFEEINRKKLRKISKDIEYQKNLIGTYEYPDKILREKGKIIYFLEEKYYDIETKYTNMCYYSRSSEKLFRKKIDFYSTEADSVFKSCERKFKFLSWVLYITAIVYSLHKEDIYILHVFKNVLLSHTSEKVIFFLFILNVIFTIGLLIYFSVILIKFFTYHYLVWLYKKFRQIFSKIYLCPILISSQAIDRFLYVLIKIHWIIYFIFSYVLIDFYFILEK